jgi:hypothetical protein
LAEPGIPQVAAQDSGNLATPIPPGALLEAIGHWNQKLDLILRNPAHFTMKDYRILLTIEGQFPDPQFPKSAYLELLITVNNSGYPLFLPPLPLSDWKFLGYYSIPYVSSGFAVFGAPDFGKNSRLYERASRLVPVFLNLIPRSTTPQIDEV